MRLIKLSTQHFANEKQLDGYFKRELNGKRRFYFNTQIREDGIMPGETVLFSLRGRLLYVAKATVGRTRDPERKKGKYQNYIVIGTPIRKLDVSLEEFERKLETKANLKISLKGQGWNIIEDSKRTEKTIDSFTFADGSTILANDVPDEVPAKIKLTIKRFIRDTKMTRMVKGQYKNRCQICGKRMKIQPGVFYAEAHHLKPLGNGHKGSDVRDNILCLCPNHHALFDYFAIPLDPAKLRLNKHNLRQSFIDYHNAHFRQRQGAVITSSRSQ
jgi:hypothetical protein